VQRGDNLQSLTLGSNITSVLLQGVLKKHTSEVNLASERLATGLRINRPSDDVGGYVYSEKLNSKIRGTDVAIRNVSDGIAVSDTGSKSLTNVLDNLKEIKKLVTAAGSKTDEEKNADQITINNLVQEIGDLRNKTEHNGIFLLQGTYNKTIQTGPDANNTYALNFTTGSWDGADIDVTTFGSTAPTDIGKLGYQSTKALNNISVSTTVPSLGGALGSAVTDLGDLDKMIRNVTVMKASFTARNNALSSTKNYLSDNKTTLENAKDNFTEADTGAETARLSISQILQQSVVSLLAQANASPQIALSLIP